MPEAARRSTQTGGYDVVRRLLARPIRMEHLRPLAQTAHVVRDESTADASDEADDADDIERLEAELSLTKAILQAERQETAALRARIERGEPDNLGEEGRAVRDRWSLLVDDLLRSPR